MKRYFSRNDQHEFELHDTLEEAKAARDCVLTAMHKCREHADALESMVDDTLWVLPKYAELLWVH